MTTQVETWKIAYYLYPGRQTPVTVSYRELREDEISDYRREDDLNYTHTRFPPLDGEPGRFEYIRKSHLFPDINQAQEYLDFTFEMQAKIREMRGRLITLEGVGF